MGSGGAKAARGSGIVGLSKTGTARILTDMASLQTLAHYQPLDLEQIPMPAQPGPS